MGWESLDLCDAYLEYSSRCLGIKGFMYILFLGR
jgi:hypothetical protein